MLHITPPDKALICSKDKNIPVYEYIYIYIHSSPINFQDLKYLPLPNTKYLVPK